jgi:malate dehydrogenase (oxaloacetate-decarboxylating)(NADP+)
LEIAKNPQDVYRYTSKGNLVAVITNGTAVLGLGDIGPEASKPVMEGKGVLFKKFAGIDVFDLEIDAKDPDDFIKIVKSLQPTFGGINLEDIKAPESFYIEEVLRREMTIPVMHDDQHGTAIISAAALLNALVVARKKIGNVKVVINGAGAAAIACTKLWISLGVKRSNVVMCDSKGVITKRRNNIDESKRQFATYRHLKTLHDAIKGADVFLGLSKADVLKPKDLKSMAKKPIVFALANPNPEIEYDVAIKTRKDIIIATGRSDHPNQVNNVLGFPYIFRGALDVRANAINEEMKKAAVIALANLAKEPVPDIVKKAYGDDSLKFGANYLIPKPLDSRLLTTIAPAVAKAAIKSKVAGIKVKDWEEYNIFLQKKIGIDTRLINRIISRAKRDPKRVIFTEANNYKILKAAQIIKDENIGKPILLGKKKEILNLIKIHDLDLKNVVIIDPYEEDNKREVYGKILYESRKRKGLILSQAVKQMRDRNYFGPMMLHLGEADAIISGLTQDYPKTIRPALQIVGVDENVCKVAGMYIITNKRGTFFLADTTVNINPNAEELVDIIGMTARAVHFFDIEPRIAVLSYSIFGSNKGEIPEKTRLAVQLARKKFPGLLIDGEMQANVAVNTNLQKELYPFSELIDKGANTLIFPTLMSGNSAYKLLMEIGGAEAIGPVLLGVKKPVHILQLGSSITDIVNMASLAVVDAQSREK